jgi:hypothetical protein
MDLVGTFGLDDEQSQREIVWLLKNSISQNRSKKLALGCPTNDFPGFPRHFLSPNFPLF